MGPFLLALFALAAGPAAARVAVEDTVLQHTLVLLQQRLGQVEPLHAAQVVARVGALTGRDPAQVRHHLLGRLGDLEALRQADPEAWRAVVELGGNQLSRRQAERLMRQLFAGARDILDGGDDYLLTASIDWAARGARVPADEATAYIAKLVARGIVDTTEGWAPEPKGLVVSGWTERFELSLDPLFAFFDTRDEGYVREATRDLQRFVVPRVVQRLPQSRGVRYAVRDRDATSLADPDYRLRIVVQGLSFAGSHTDLLPCMDTALELTDAGDGRAVWQATLSHCTRTHGSATVHELDPFYDEVAEGICARLDELFETRR